VKKGPVNEQSIQERYFPEGICFGCGPTNELGLKIASRPSPDGTGVVCQWQPQPHHAAGPGVLNGGIVGALLDCHSAAAIYLQVLQRSGEESLWATSEFRVRLLRPTSPEAPLELFAEVVELDEDRAIVESRLDSEGKTRATCRAEFRRFPPRGDQGTPPVV
jgi:acyl-coenzyme A thioesterase PaaI-like protein